ncbi:hypothetical protein ACM26V_09310 [Salipaludibacillus sp. HK11]|uniref:hypothetical protein n=1 Tax=Salipaludibacillus sp. HK11 TaxID=3394320 RepID=UPI0039FDAB68
MLTKTKDFKKEIQVLEKAVYVFENNVNIERLDQNRKLIKFKERLEKAKDLNQK